jgi:glycerophosphoryl diester phosphodiesterase
MMPAMDWLFDIPIAHRGLHDAAAGVPENSLAAFEAARDRGYPAELDVRLLRDGSVAVFHDDNLQRMTGSAVLLEDQDAASVKEYALGGTTEKIPVLAEVLDVVGGKTPLLFELKNFGIPGDLESAVLAALETYDGRFAVQSFNPFSMGWFKVHAPGITRGHLSGGFEGLPLEQNLIESLRRLDLVDVSAPAFVGYDIRLLPYGPVSALRARGMPVLGWTVQSEDDRRHAATCCDNYVFENIDPLGISHDT